MPASRRMARRGPLMYPVGAPLRRFSSVRAGRNASAISGLLCRARAQQFRSCGAECVIGDGQGAFDIWLTLPRTKPEDALLGETRDRILRRAGDAAHEAATSVSQLAERTLDSARRSSSESAGA